MQAAVSGEYSNYSFFGDGRSEDGYHRRLRAVVQTTLTSFKGQMRKEGKTRVIFDEESYEESDDSEDLEIQEHLCRISRSDYMEEVKSPMRRTRGRELADTWNPMIIAELFRDQCQPWKKIVGECIAEIIQDVSVGETTEAYVEISSTRRWESWRRISKRRLPIFSIRISLGTLSPTTIT